MRLERLNYNKIKIFLTFDDLTERGLTKEDLWRNSFKVQQLFREMIEQASDELGFEPTHSLSVEVFSLQAQGMVVILTTKNEAVEEFDEEYMDDFIEMQVTLDESTDVFFEFHSFEDLIQLAHRLSPLNVDGGTVYSFNDRFYLLMDFDTYAFGNTEDLIAILAEYGSPSTITKYRVHEYGKILIDYDALLYIKQTFSL
ncbi:genetic competence negative regulator [Bacillus songklensis]|uniref:Adapter protein MecA n=1 Tax=Bacillus songklensis TaxID=1069116 RepID=A0ABV8B0J9_9BACI